ncbi:MAG: phage holin family protein [Chloroflexota bacterium]|nr:phage holin family protein [Chloroflexota bacterium]
MIKDLQDVLRGEVQLAKTELKEDASTLGKGAGMLAVAAIFGLLGLIFTLLAVVYLLDKVVQLWIAAGIVGLSVLAIAAILGLVGKNRLSASNLKPEQTIETLKEDKEWASQQINSVKR